MEKINLFILDDERAFTDALKGIFTQYKEIIHVVGIAHSPHLALEFLRAKRPEKIDIVLVDLEMPKGGGGDGFDFLRDLGAELPHLKSIILTTHNAFSLASKAIELGARGFLLKNTAIEKIVPFLVEVSEGKIIIDPTIKNITSGTLPFRNIQFEEDDYAIIKYILEESTSETIAQKLAAKKNNKGSINAVYIENRRRKIIETIGCTNVVGVAKYALQTGLFPLNRGEHHPRRNGNHPIIQLPNQIKVFILDDHEVFAQGLSHLLSNIRKNVFQLIAYAKSKEEFFYRIDEMVGALPDILLLDYTLPDENVEDLVQEIKERFPNLAIIVVMPEYNAQVENVLLQAGASGLVSRKMDIVEMIEEIIQIANNNEEKKEDVAVIEPSQQLFDTFEIEIIYRILEEKDSRTIANELYANELALYKGEAKLLQLKRITNRIDAKRTRILDKIGGVNVVSLVKHAWTEYMF